jgi:hypothetical protein
MHVQARAETLRALLDVPSDSTPEGAELVAVSAVRDPLKHIDGFVLQDVACISDLYISNGPAVRTVSPDSYQGEPAHICAWSGPEVRVNSGVAISSTSKPIVVITRQVRSTTGSSVCRKPGPNQASDWTTLASGAAQPPVGVVIYDDKLVDMFNVDADPFTLGVATSGSLSHLEQRIPGHNLFVAANWSTTSPSNGQIAPARIYRIAPQQGAPLDQYINQSADSDS